MLFDRSIGIGNSSELADRRDAVGESRNSGAAFDSGVAQAGAVLVRRE